MLRIARTFSVLLLYHVLYRQIVPLHINVFKAAAFVIRPYYWPIVILHLISQIYIQFWNAVSWFECVVEW